MQQYVYILSVYDEHGSEEVCATLDRAQLPKMVKRWHYAAIEILPEWPEDRKTRVEASNQDRAKQSREIDESIVSLLERTDEDLSARSATLTKRSGMGVNGHELQSGWGGVMLHVVPLEEWLPFHCNLPPTSPLP